METGLNLSPELLEKAKSAPSAAALQALAQENGATLTAEQAATYYAQFHPKTGALSDEELDNVAGGCGEEEDAPPEKCRFCGETKFTKKLVILDCRWVCDNCAQFA